jgi:hypothetical protein
MEELLHLFGWDGVFGKQMGDAVDDRVPVSDFGADEVFAFLLQGRPIVANGARKNAEQVWIDHARISL